MSLLQHRSRLLAACALIPFSFVQAWTSSDLTVDLAWPPVTYDGYITQNGRRISSAADASAFPCANITPPVSPASRVDFPLTGARLQFDLHNTSAQTAGWNFVVDAYLGQFSNDVNPKKTGWTYLTTLVYDDIIDGFQCTEALNITDEILNTPAVNLQLANTAGNDLVGVYVTLGLRITLFNTGDNFYATGGNQEEMYQCAYLELVGNTSPVTETRGVCNANPYATNPYSASPSSTTPSSATSTPSSTASSVVSNSATATPTGTVSTGNVAATSHTSLSHGSIIGIAVGVVMLSALLLLGFGYAMLRRRRSKKPKPTMALGFWTAGQEMQPRSCVDCKGKICVDCKEKELDDSASSIGGSTR